MQFHCHIPKDLIKFDIVSQIIISLFRHVKLGTLKENTFHWANNRNKTYIEERLISHSVKFLFCFSRIEKSYLFLQTWLLQTISRHKDRGFF